MYVSDSPPRRTLFEALKRMRDAWPSGGWTWDRRFDCVASTFGVELSEPCRTASGIVFPSTWTKKTLPTAPPIIHTIAEHTGGVRSDQLLLATDFVDDLMAYGLWWPWGGEGTNISMRIGLAGDVAQDEELGFRQLFGALDD